MSKEFRHFIPESARYRGREFEYDVFSEVKATPEYEEAILKILNKRDLEVVKRIREGIEFTKELRPIVNEILRKIEKEKEKIMDIVKNYQPFDPTNPIDPRKPTQTFLKDLRLSIIEKLELDLEEKKVKVYTSVNTPLDVIGIDSFIVLEDDRPRVVTLDATLRREKLEKLQKADIVFSELPDPEINEEEYLQEVDKIADRIVRMWKS